MFSCLEGLKSWVLFIGASVSSKTTYPCNKAFMTVDAIFLTDIILSMMLIASRTRILNISAYSSIGCTKVTKQLKNSPLSLPTWYKTQKWVWKIMDFLVRVNRLPHHLPYPPQNWKWKAWATNQAQNFIT